MSRLLWILMLVLLVGTAVGASWAFKQANSFGDPVKSEVLAPAPPPPTVVALGFVDGDPIVARPAVLGQGTIKEVIGEGTQVKRGDILLRLDEGLAKATLAEANADLDAAKEKHSQALDLPKQYELKIKQQEQAIAAHEAKRKGVKLEQERMLQQAKDTGTKVNPKILEGLEESLKQMDALIEAEKLKRDEIKLFRPQSEMNRALADVKAKEAQVAKAQWALDQCKLEAASDGLVLRVNVAVGEVLVPNIPGRAPPIEFLPKGAKIVRAEVLQEWAHLVKIGQEVDIEDDSYQGPTWKGKVRFLSYWFAEKRHRIMEPFMLNDVRTLECLVEVADEEPLLRIGQRVKVKIKTK